MYYVYVGPDGQGYDYAPGFDLSNYVLIGGNFPTANVFFQDGLSSPLTDGMDGERRRPVLQEPVRGGDLRLAGHGKIL